MVPSLVVVIAGLDTANQNDAWTRKTFVGIELLSIESVPKANE
jgi:hypothetical protein